MPENPDGQVPAANDVPTIDAEHAVGVATVSISAGAVLQSLAGRGAGTNLLLAADSVADVDQSPAPPATQPPSGRY